jgi:hypothetical protein
LEALRKEIEKMRGWEGGDQRTGKDGGNKPAALEV